MLQFLWNSARRTIEKIFFLLFSSRNFIKTETYSYILYIFILYATTHRQGVPHVVQDVCEVCTTLGGGQVQELCLGGDGHARQVFRGVVVLVLDDCLEWDLEFCIIIALLIIAYCVVWFVILNHLFLHKQSFTITIFNFTL